MENLSVVVITRNRLDKLKRCLESVRKVLPRAEIIVVDNGSDDGTRDYLENIPWIKSVVLRNNVGPAAGRNIAISQCNGKYFLFIDDDAWIESLNVLELFKYFVAHQNIGIIAPRIYYPNNKLQESVRMFPTLSALFWRGTGLYKLFPNVSWYRKYILVELKSAPKIQNVDWAILACQVVRGEVFDKVGLFDEKHYFYEDADFCLRARQKGYLTVYWPNVTIYHEYARTSARGINVSLFRHVASIIRFFLKSARIRK